MEAGGAPSSSQSSPTRGEGNGETIEMCRRGSDAGAEAAEVHTRQPASAKDRILQGARRAFRLKEPPPPGRQLLWLTDRPGAAVCGGRHT